MYVLSLYECFVFAGDVVLKDLLIKESALVSTSCHVARRRMLYDMVSQYLPSADSELIAF